MISAPWWRQALVRTFLKIKAKGHDFAGKIESAGE
jgi:hypothetical protein